MRLRFTLNGVSPLLMHNGAAGIDARCALSRENAALAAKTARDRTDADDLRLQEIECRRSLYLDEGGKPTLPASALRVLIEAGARKLKKGPMAAGLVVMLGGSTACADCLSARQALVTARRGTDLAVLEETAASQRYLAARGEAEAARLRLGREQRRAGNASRDHAEARDVRRFLDDDRDAVRAGEESASAAYDRALEACRHAADASRDAAAGRNRARSALTDAELVVLHARDALRDAWRRVRRECGP